jgi:hypothetical protein
LLLSQTNPLLSSQPSASSSQRSLLPNPASLLQTSYRSPARKPARYMILSLKRTCVALCRRELIFKIPQDFIFSNFRFLIEAAAKMRLFLISVKCYFHFFYIYFSVANFKKQPPFSLRRVANIQTL